MGQYLAIGLAIKIDIEKSDIEKIQLDIRQLIEKMKKQLYFVPEIYTLSHDENYYYFILKDDILHNQLIPLLQELYPLLYDDPDDYNSVLVKLGELPSSEWLTWAKVEFAEGFQYNRYGLWDYFKEDYQTIAIHCDDLTLSREGKISMEAFHRQFKFLRYTMIQAFKQFSLAGALRLYING